MASGRARRLSVGVTEYKITVEAAARFGSMAPGGATGGSRFRRRATLWVSWGASRH